MVGGIITYDLLHAITNQLKHFEMIKRRRVEKWEKEKREKRKKEEEEEEDGGVEWMKREKKEDGEEGDGGGWRRGKRRRRSSRQREGGGGYRINRRTKWKMKTVREKIGIKRTKSEICDRKKK